jgi:hypothetical protein
MSSSTASKLSREQLDAILFPVAKPKSVFTKLSPEEFKKLLDRAKIKSREESRQKYLLKQSQRQTVSKKVLDTVPQLLQKPDSDGLAFSFSKSNSDTHLFKNHGSFKTTRLAGASGFQKDLKPAVVNSEADDELRPSFIPVSSKRAGCSDRVFHTLFRSSSVNPHEQRFVEQSVLSEIKTLLEFLHGASIDLSQSRDSLDGLSFFAESTKSRPENRIYPIRATISLAWLNSRNPQKLSFLTSSHADKIAQTTSSVHTVNTGLRLLINLRFWSNDVPLNYLQRFDVLALSQIKNFCKVMDSVAGIQFTTEIMKGVSPAVLSVPDHIDELIDPLSESNWPEEKSFREFQVASESFHHSPDPKDEYDSAHAEELNKDVSKKISSLPLSRDRSSRTLSESFYSKSDLHAKLFRWRKTIVSRPFFKK